MCYTFGLPDYTNIKSDPRALYIQKEWLMTHRVLVSSIVIRNTICNQI
jgi:hypothetical protein